MASNILSYLRIPVMASSAIAALASSLLYFKQKYVFIALGLPLLMLANTQS